MLTVTLTPIPRPRKVAGVAPWVRLVRETREGGADPARLPGRTPCRTPRAAVDLLGPTLEAEEQEVMVALVLDAQHQVLARVEVTRGLVDASLVHPREVFRVAIALGASALIVAHNHPSGNPSPSAEDRAITQQLVSAGRLLDIPVHDHLIIGSEGRYFSFAESGQL